MPDFTYIKEHRGKVIDKLSFTTIINQDKRCIKKLTEHCLEITFCTGMSSPFNFREEAFH